MHRLMIASLLVSCGSGSYLDHLNKCQIPRQGVDQITGRPYPDKSGSAAEEREFLKGWSDDTYLWYRDLPNPDPKSFASTTDYFMALKSPATTASGALRDRFHFFYDTEFWESLSQAGVRSGYGAHFIQLLRFTPNRIFVAWTEPGSPAVADSAGLARGAEIVSVDGQPALAADGETWNAGLTPEAAGESHTFTVIDRGSATPRTFTMSSANVTMAPVQHAGLIPGTTVGYMHFTTHIQTAEAALVNAILGLQAAGATDLVLDMRYNGGGLLDIASELAYMISKPSVTRGRTFESTQFNDKHREQNPITGDPLLPTPFWSTGQDFTVSSGTALPHLDLDRVFILEGSNTCSASEAVINGLLGVGVQVILIGGAKTCGKPYGFYPQANCGTTYFSIQFQGVNDKGFGDYSDGFVPNGGGQAGPPGCVVQDDFTHEQGDPEEGLLAAALAYRANGACPPTPTRTLVSSGDNRMKRDAFLENRIVLVPRN